MVNKYQEYLAMAGMYIDDYQTRPGISVFRGRGAFDNGSGFNTTFLFNDNSHVLIYNFDYIFVNAFNDKTINDMNNKIKIGKIYAEDGSLHFSYTMPFTPYSDIDLEHALEFTSYLVAEVNRIFNEFMKPKIRWI